MLCLSNIYWSLTAWNVLCPHREALGLAWETSRFVTTGTQGVWWNDVKASVNPGVGGDEKVCKEVRLGLGLERKLGL